MPHNWRTGHWAIWRIPFMLAFSTAIGLVLALFEDGQPWRGRAWLLLAAPLVVTGTAYLRGR